MHRNSMLIKIQPDATVCRYLLTAKSLYMFRVSQHPSSATSLQQRGPIGPRWREVADDGCCDTRNMQSDFAVNKYLHTVASGWIFINIVHLVTIIRGNLLFFLVFRSCNTGESVLSWSASSQFAALPELNANPPSISENNFLERVSPQYFLQLYRHVNIRRQAVSQIQ